MKTPAPLPAPTYPLRFTIALLLASSLSLSSASAVDLSQYRLLDLTHAYNEHTLYWPTSTKKFELTSTAHGETDGGYFYSSNDLSSPEHGGTHLDAPIHFAAAGWANDQIPLSQLIAPGVVIDVSTQAASDRNYRLTVADVLAFEQAHGEIAPGTIVLLRTDWDQYWPDAKAYLGDDTPGDASQLSFPSYGAEATRLLVEQRQVAVLGVDTASLDYGQSTDFMVHRIAAAQNVLGLENLKSLAQLPPTNFTVFALPMKITNGSGGPARVVALVPNE